MEETKLVRMTEHERDALTVVRRLLMDTQDEVLERHCWLGAGTELKPKRFVQPLAILINVDSLCEKYDEAEGS